LKNRLFSSILCVIISLSIISFISYMNFLTPLFADDFSYSVSFVTKEPISSFTDVLKSQYLHYFTTNGRSVVHTLAQVLLAIGKPALNIINGVTFLAFCLLICYHGLGSIAKVRSHHLIIVFAALWFLTPHFGGSYLWVMGAANYLYSPLIILLFFIPYRRSLTEGTKEGSKHPVLLAVVNAFLGVIAGWTNENTSLALIVMVAAVIGVHIVTKNKIHPWMLTGFIGNIVGCALLFFSPAQAKRLSSAGGFGGLSQWISRFKSITRDAVEYLWLPALLAVIALAVFFITAKRARNSAADVFHKLAPVIVFTLGTGISIYSMVGSPMFPVWVWSSILAFALIAVLNAVDALEFSRVKFFKYGKSILAIALIFAVAASYVSISPELHRIDEAYGEREALIAEALDTDLTVELITTDCRYSSYSLFHELSTDSSVWPNTAVANYYGLKSISVILNNSSGQ